MHTGPETNPQHCQPESTSELLQRRDPHAVDELLRRYRPLLRAIVAGEIDPGLRAKVDPSDLVQEASMEIAKSIDKIQSTQSPPFLAYLRQVVINKLHDARRKFLLSHKRNVQREQKTNVQRVDELVRSEASRQDVLDELINQELLEATQSALGKLPLEIKKVLLLRFLRQLTYLEIGQKLGRSEDDVRMLVKRWLSRVRKEVKATLSSSF
jgi:RNA polymerase sigma-70 factor (ECF subfamily)